MEVGKTLRAVGANGHGYEETVSDAADYIHVVKPIAQDPIGQDEDSNRALRHFADEEELTSLVVVKAPDRAESVVRAWVAADSATVRLIAEARAIARTSSTVLVRGESGTGKDLLTWILHALSPRADRPLVRVDCASLPPDLTESELFGHELGSPVFASGSFGRLEMAAGELSSSMKSTHSAFPRKRNCCV